jgi:hypothetical protein
MVVRQELSSMELFHVSDQERDLVNTAVNEVVFQNTVACRPAARQRPRIKQLYNIRC